MAVTWKIQGFVVTVTLDGDYPFDEVIEALQQALADPSSTPGMALLFDERLSLANPSSEEKRARVHWIVSLRPDIAARCAFVVGAKPDYRYGMARMAGIYFELEGMRAQIFFDVESASRWLSEVPGPAHGGRHGVGPAAMIK